ncbi:MAG: hypothetical protein ACK5R4_06760, partial [Alphaproteobacteria bacterium]
PILVSTKARTSHHINITIRDLTSATLLLRSPLRGGSLVVLAMKTKKPTSATYSIASTNYPYPAQTLTFIPQINQFLSNCGYI